MARDTENSVKSKIIDRIKGDMKKDDIAAALAYLKVGGQYAKERPPVDDGSISRK